MTRLFHRYPMLRIDRVLAVVPGRSATAVFVPSGNDALVRSGPFYPAMLLVEAMAQTAAIFGEGAGRTESGTLASFHDVTFGDPVRVGVPVTVTSSFVGGFGKLLRMHGRAEATGQVAAEGDITIAL
ncbi:MAG: beta-hydroxyacyl-ACP dehydratase [Acidobacteriota bacterium]